MPLVKPRPARPMPIRMTPLIDVVFILLVFFMVTSYLLPTSYLELANETSASSSADAEPLPELTLTRTGDIRWRDQLWQPDQLTRQLKAGGNLEVHLATEEDVPLDNFTRALSSLDNAGITAHWQRTPSENSPGS